jgi:hypothetical protein
MRRILIAAAIVGASFAGIQNATAQTCGAGFCFDLNACNGNSSNTNVCPTATQCSGGTNVCPHARNCTGNTNICGFYFPEG